MRKTLAAYLAACATLAALAAFPASSAGGPPRRRVVYRYPVQQGPQQPRPGVVAATAVLAASPTVLPTGGGYDAALAAVNGWRLAHGRGPLAWSPDLAGWASRNAGVHGVMAPGASQCQAWCSDPVTAVRQWIASPAHASILLNATQVIGIGASAGGFTANAR